MKQSYRLSNGNATWHAWLSEEEVAGYKRDGYAVTAAFPPVIIEIDAVKLRATQVVGIDEGLDKELVYYALDADGNEYTIVRHENDMSTFPTIENFTWGAFEMLSIKDCPDAKGRTSEYMTL